MLYQKWINYGLLVILNVSQVMLPFTPTKGNLCRLLTAVRDVKHLVEENLQADNNRSSTCLLQGVTEATGQYRRHLNAMGQLQQVSIVYY